MRNIFNGFSAISAFHPATGIRWYQGHSQYRILAHVSGGLPPGPLIHRHQYSTMSSTGRSPACHRHLYSIRNAIPWAQSSWTVLYNCGYDRWRVSTSPDLLSPIPAITRASSIAVIYIPRLSSLVQAILIARLTTSNREIPAQRVHYSELMMRYEFNEQSCKRPPPDPTTNPCTVPRKKIISGLTGNRKQTP